MIRGVLFDLGETLVRFSGDWPEIFERSRRRVTDDLLEQGFALEPDEFSWELLQRIVAAQDERERDFIERPTDEVFRQVMADFGHTRLPEAVIERSMELLYGESEDHWQAVAGLDQILDQIKATGVRLGLISNASDVANVDRLIDKIGVRHFFDPILVSAAVGVRKPAPLIFQKALSQWDLPAAQTVMVGDTLPADILGAQRLGMHQIWLKTAVDRDDNLVWADKIKPEMQADTLAEIPELLASMLNPASQ